MTVVTPVVVSPVTCSGDTEFSDTVEVLEKFPSEENDDVGSTAWTVAAVVTIGVCSVVKIEAISSVKVWSFSILSWHNIILGQRCWEHLVLLTK